ncbi:hypothetical protein BTVI_33736 [Pitangus sulphuratus]|nr:hypothetical protein BTVI_33736 [Pitangus sulphuratus]
MAMEQWYEKMPCYELNSETEPGGSRGGGTTLKPGIIRLQRMRLVPVLPPISVLLVYTALVCDCFSVGMGVMRTAEIARDDFNHHQITAMPEANYNSSLTVSPCYLCDRDGDNEN